MKTKSLFISAFGVLAMSAMTLLSCTKDETEPTGDGNEGTPSGEVTAPVLSSDKESVVLADESADQTAVTFSWTAAKDGESDADVSYTLYLNLSSKDIFTEPYSKTLGKGLTASFTNAELNTILVEELGAETESAVDIQALVYATPADESAEAMQSNKVTVNVTTYAEAIVFPDALVAAGSAIGSNDRALGTEIAKTGEGTYKAEGVRIWTSNDAALKFYPDDETSEWCVVAKATESWQDMTIDVEYLKAPQGGDIYPSRISGFTFGEYTVEIDLNAGTLTLTRTGDISVSDLELPDELYMRGDAIADNPTWDWELAKNMPLVKTSDKVYEAKNISLNFGGDGTMGFNIFTGYEADNPMLGMAAESANGNIILALAATGEDRFRPGTIGYENGVYNIKVDFNTQQMTLYDSPSESFLEFFLYSPCRFLKSFPSTLSLRKEEIVLDLGLCTGRPDDKLLSGFLHQGLKHGESIPEFFYQLGSFFINIDFLLDYSVRQQLEPTIQFFQFLIDGTSKSHQLG